MKRFPTNKDIKFNSDNIFFGEFIPSQRDGLSDSLRVFESNSTRKAVRNGILLPAILTILFMPAVNWFIGLSGYLLAGGFLAAMIIMAYSAYSLGYRTAFSAFICYAMLGCGAILSIVNRDTGGVFINGLSIFLLTSAFLFPPKLYFWSLLPVIATIFFQYLDGTTHLLGITEGSYSTAEKIALTCLWMVVFVAVTQIIRRNYLSTLEKIVFLNNELESTKESLLSANQNLDDLNKSLEDRIDKRTQSMQEALLKAEAANVARGRFFATMSHEFRTPLNAIIGYSENISEILYDEDESEDTRKEVAYSVENVLSAGKSLLALVNDVLEISQLESGGTALNVGQVDLHKFEKELHILIDPIIKQNKNQLLINNKSKTDFIYTDEKKFQRILVNLLGNAAKFTEKGSVELNISKGSENSLMFEVKDNGVGISADKLDKVFDPFMQAEETNTYNRQFGGAGLGLAICKQLAIDLNGELSVTSKLGEGTSFKLILPKQIA